jgi:hypothetical protein
MQGAAGSERGAVRTLEGHHRSLRRLIVLLLSLLAAGALLTPPPATGAVLTSRFRVKGGNDWTRQIRVAIGDEGWSPFFHPGVLVWDGGSILEGLHSPDEETPPSLALKLIPHTVRSYLAIDHGARISSMLLEAPTKVDVHHDPEADADVCIAMPGGSDLYSGMSPDELLESVRQYCLERRSVGFQVVIVTLLPRNEEGFEVARTRFNDLLRTHWPEFSDGLADIGGDRRIGDALDCLDLKYYRSDGTHPTAAGDAVIAGIIAPVVSDLAWRSNGCEMRFRNEDQAWTDWRSYAAKVEWWVEPPDGVKTVEAEYRMRGGPATGVSDDIALDTIGPRTRALDDASVRRGQKVSLRYRAVDPAPGSVEVRVNISVRAWDGHLVKRLELGPRPIGEDLRAAFVCNLPKGRYTWAVHARDAAGNPETRTGRAHLRVR